MATSPTSPVRTKIRHYQMRRDTAANWAMRNPVLLDGEFGIEKDTRLFKIGDGVLAWNDLDYGGLRGANGDNGFISTDPENRLTQGIDGGLYVPELNLDVLASYILSKN